MARPPSKTASGSGAPRQPTWFTPGRLLLLALAVFVLGGIAVALDLKFITGGKPRKVLPRSLVVLDPHTMQTVENVRGRAVPSPALVVRAGGLIWTIDRETNHLRGTNPGSGRVLRNVTLGTEPVALASGFGSVWVANSGNDSVTRVEIAGSKVEALGLRDEPSGIATGAGSVWVVSGRSRRVLRLDPETNLVTKSVRLSEPPLTVAVRAGRVLVAVGD